METISKKRAAFYPYTNEFLSLDKFADQIKEFQIDYLIVPKGASVKKSSKTTTMLPDENLDTLLIGHDKHYLMPFDTTYYPLICEAILRGINICFISSFSEHDMEMITEFNQTHNQVTLSLLNKYVNPQQYLIDPANAISAINVPVIFVVSTLERCRKFEVELGLQNKFSQKGYNTILIGSKPYSELFGAYPYPDFMFEKIHESHKIINLNILCKSIEARYKPDLFIIGVPGTIMPYNDSIVNHFGVTAFETARAVRPDLVVLNVNYEKYSTNAIDRLCEDCTSAIGTQPSAVCIADTQLDLTTVPENVLNYLYVSEDKVRQTVSELASCNCHVAMALDDTSMIRLADDMEDILATDDVVVV